jgi:tetratricopeptide (TPR) repeat protein
LLFRDDRMKTSPRRVKKTWCWMAIFFLAVMLSSFATRPAQAQEEGYELLWRRRAGGNFSAASVCADGSFIAAGSDDDQVYLFNREGRLLWKYETGGSVNAVSISADGSFIAAGSDDSKVYLFDREGKPLWSYETGDVVEDVSLSTDGSLIAAGSDDDQVYFFNGEGGLLWSYETGDNINAVSISADSSYIAAGSDDDKLYFFDGEGKLLWSYRTAGDINAVSLSADGSLIAAGSDDHKFRFFNREGGLLWSHDTGRNVRAIAVSPDKSLVAAGAENGLVYIFNRKEVEFMRSHGTEGDVNAVSVSSDGSYIAAGSDDDKLYFFDREGKLLWSYYAGDNIEAVSLSANGFYIAVGSWKNELGYLLFPFPAAREAIARSRQAISSVKDQGINITSAEDLMAQAEQAFEAGEYKSAKGLAERAEARLSRIVKQATPVRNVLDTARAILDREKLKGFNIAEVEGILSEAEQAFDKGDYQRAEVLAGQAETILSPIVERATSAWNALEVARASLAQEKARGLDVAEVEVLLSEAEQAFKAGLYEETKRLAEKSRALVLDIDYDGIPNESDFAPTVKNTYVYIGASAVALGIVVSASIGIFIYRRRKRF